MERNLILQKANYAEYVITDEKHDLKVSELRVLYDMAKAGKVFEALTTAYYAGFSDGYSQYADENEK